MPVNSSNNILLICSFCFLLIVIHYLLAMHLLNRYPFLQSALLSTDLRRCLGRHSVVSFLLNNCRSGVCALLSLLQNLQWAASPATICPTRSKVSFIELRLNWRALFGNTFFTWKIMLLYGRSKQPLWAQPSTLFWRDGYTVRPYILQQLH